MNILDELFQVISVGKGLPPMHSSYFNTFFFFLITRRLTYCQCHVLSGKLYLAREPVGSLVDTVVKVMLLMQKIEDVFV